MLKRSLDLECGQNLRGPEDFERWGIDVTPHADPNVLVADLTFETIPFPDEHFDRVLAFDFLEHLPMRAWVMDPNGRGRTINVMVNLFNEVSRSSAIRRTYRNSVGSSSRPGNTSPAGAAWSA